MQAWTLSDLASLAIAGGMDTFVPDSDHINALPYPVRKFVHDLETRADPAGDVAEIALLKENNLALWNRVKELEAEVKRLCAQPDLAAELQRIYDSEINVRLSWLWDGGFEVGLGDKMNGYVAEETVRTAAEILPWLQDAIVHFFPESPYAASLSPEIRERAKNRLFRTPQEGARAICPHCGASNAASSMDVSFAFVCAQCGASVMLDQPKVQ
jgi:hypothetical protein